MTCEQEWWARLVYDGKGYWRKTGWVAPVVPKGSAAT